jgi:virginiamycin B lyase
MRAAGVAAVAVLCWSSFATAQTATEFTIPTPASKPFGIATGPDGALWFVEGDGNKIGRITTAGAVTEYTIPTKTTFGNFSSHPQCIVAGPDGAMWFVEGDGNKIGRITTAGVITEFPNFAGGWPQCLTVGPDGALWISDQGPMGGGKPTGDGWIGRITTAGVLTRFPLPRPNVQANFITAGDDGALWFGTDANTIARITTAGVVTEFTLPTPNTVVFGITAGPDGALWFAEPVANKIGRITTAGVITEFALPTAGSGPSWLVTGPDGALWFTEAAPVPTANNDLVFAGNKIGRITTSGAITEFTLPTAGSGPVVIAAGPDGAMWFTEATASKIGRLTLPARFVSQGGLTWSPASSTYYNYAAADAYCRNATFNGSTGWRLPTLAELSGITNPPSGLMTPSTIPSATGGLYPFGAINGMGWTAIYLWSSTPTTAPSDNFPGYWGLFLVDRVIDAGLQVRAGNVVNSGTLDNGNVTCVQSSAGTTTTGVTPTTPLPPPPAAQTAYTVPSGQLPAAAVAVSATGTYGSASLSVTLDIVKVLQTTFAASPAYNVYVVALVPGALLGSASPMFFVKPKAPGNWGPLASPIAAFLENVAQIAVANQVTIEILTDTNISTLVGTEIYIGYGSDGNEMLAAGRYRGVYKVQ